MLIKVIEITLFVVTLFLLWLCCYPDYVVIWGKGILRLFRIGGKEPKPVAEKPQNNLEEKHQ